MNEGIDPLRPDIGELRRRTNRLLVRYIYSGRLEDARALAVLKWMRTELAISLDGDPSRRSAVRIATIAVAVALLEEHIERSPGAPAGYVPADRNLRPTIERIESLFARAFPDFPSVPGAEPTTTPQYRHLKQRSSPEDLTPVASALADHAELVRQIQNDVETESPDAPMVSATDAPAVAAEAGSALNQALIGLFLYMGPPPSPTGEGRLTPVNSGGGAAG